MSGKPALYEFENFTFQGKAYVFLGVPHMRYTVPPLDFALTGNDPRGVLRKYVPRNTVGGIYVGPVNELVENTVITKEPIPQPNGSRVPAGFRVKTEVTSVTGELPYSDDPLIASYFRPMGVDAGTHWTIGGSSEARLTSLLIVRLNTVKKIRKLYEAHYYYNGAIDPSPQITSERKIDTRKLNFTPCAGKAESGCYLPIGQQSMIGWFFKIKPDGSNMLVHPAYPDIDIGTPQFTPYYFV